MLKNKTYSSANFFLIRSPCWTREKLDQLHNENDWMDYVCHLFEKDNAFKAAIFCASPKLFYSALKPTPKNKKKVSYSLMKYALRMASRTTPFGLFTINTIGTFRNSTNCSYDLSKIFYQIRPDMQWLYSYILSLYGDKDRFPWLPVKANPLIEVSSTQYHLTYIKGVDEIKPGLSKIKCIDKTRLTEQIFAASKDPVTVINLFESINKIIGGLEKEKTTSIIFSLLKEQFLLPGVTPSIISSSPIDDLISKLTEDTYLKEVRKKVSPENISKTNIELETLIDTHKFLGKTSSLDCLFQVDQGYSPYHLSLGDNVRGDIERGVNILYSISPKENNFAGLDSFHRQFLEKYGTHQIVPIKELLNPRTGLGTRKNWLTDSLNREKARLKKLLSIKWQSAISNKETSIVLNDEDLQYLHEASPKPPLPSVDLFCKVIASSEKSIQSNDYQIFFDGLNWNGEEL